MGSELPNRSLFKAPEVCEIAQLQPYVLRSWEAEFPDLGVTRAGAPGRVYRRHDVERVLRLKHLLFVEGLTLAGARRRLEEDRAPLPEPEEIAGASRVAARPSAGDAMLRRRVAQLQRDLRSLLDLLDRKSSSSPRAAAAPSSAARRAEGTGSRSRQPSRTASRHGRSAR